MKLDLRALKSKASTAMRGASPGAVRMTLLYLLLTTVISTGLDLFVISPLGRLSQLISAGLDATRAWMLAMSSVGAVGLFLHVLILIFSVVIGFSYQQWCLGTTRGGIGDYGDLFGGFSMAGRVILLRITVLLYSFLWYVVIFMPAFVVVLIASQLGPVGVIPAVFVFLCSLVFLIWRVLHYSMAAYCLMDAPEKGVVHAIRESRKMMRGHCGQYFLMHLSFIGWHLVGGLITCAAESLLLLILGGGYLLLGDMPGAMSAVNGWFLTVPLVTLAGIPFLAWLTPYQAMTECCFYDWLCSAQPEQPVHYEFH